MLYAESFFPARCHFFPENTAPVAAKVYSSSSTSANLINLPSQALGLSHCLKNIHCSGTGFAGLLRDDGSVRILLTNRALLWSKWGLG